MNVVQDGQMVFKKVAISETKRLFRDVCKDKVQVAIKGAAQEEIFHLIAVQFEKEEALLCHHTADSKNITTAQKVIVNFSYKMDRYFFQTDLHFEVGWAVLKLQEVDVFLLQRRTNARIDIPEKYEALFIISQHADKRYFMDCRLKDISAGGFKMEFTGSQPELKVGDHVKGTLRLGARRPMEFMVEVRFVQRIEDKDGIRQISGVQFQNVDHLMESRLLSLIMDLQREIFVKYPQKK